MAALTFFAYAFLGLGPGIVFYLAFLSHKSFISLIVIFSAFSWLCVMLLTASIFIGFYPIDATIGSYAGVVAGCVFIEELFRYAIWRLHKFSLIYIERVSRETNTSFTMLDRMYLALGWGYGQGACHVVFLFASLLQLTSSSGTFYIDTCPDMSLFLVLALYSIAFGCLLPSLMVLYFEGCQSGNMFHMAAAPLLHFAAALLTVGNMTHNGCLWVMPVIIVIGVASVVYTGRLCWSKILKEDYKKQMVPLSSDESSTAEYHEAGDVVPQLQSNHRHSRQAGTSEVETSLSSALIPGGSSTTSQRVVPSTPPNQQ